MQATFTPSHRGGTGTPLVLVHGFTDTWRSWQLVLEALEGEHDVLAVTLVGHAGGPGLPSRLRTAMFADAIEAAMDEAGFQTAHVVGNSLGGYLALQLGERGRARSIVAFAPAGGWAEGDESFRATLEHFVQTQKLVRSAVAYVDQLVATPDGRRTATQFIVTNFEHIPAELIAHQIRGVAACEAEPLIELALAEGWQLDPERIACPLRIVWGTEDKLLQWPGAAARYRAALAHAEWVELDGIGHCPQLDVPAQASDLILGFTGH